MKAAVSIMPEVPWSKEELVDNSSSPPERGLPAVNKGVVRCLMKSPRVTPTSKEKIVPSHTALIKDNRSDGESKISRHNRRTLAPVQENLQDGS